MIHLYTGEGKGKTTAAVGLAVRAAGCGMRVIFAQFMKGNDTGELQVLQELPNVRILRSQKQFGFYKTLREDQKAELARIHDGLLEEIIEAVQKRACDMVILDEITYPVNWGLIEAVRLKELISMVQSCEEGAPELVLTGRNPADFLVDCADYVTQMQAVRHPFERGIAARKGIEF